MVNIYSEQWWWFLKGVVKTKQYFYCQADGKVWLTPLWSAFHDFLVCVWPQIISICIPKLIFHKKKVIFVQLCTKIPSSSPPLKNTTKVWGCVARRDLGDRSPFKRQTATKFWGFETQVWSICFCICFPTGTEHLSYVAHTVRLPRLGLPWKVSSFHHASKCNTPQFDIEGGRTPSIMCNHPVEGNFVTLCKCFPFPNTARTHKHFKMDRDCEHPNKSC